MYSTYKIKGYLVMIFLLPLNKTEDVFTSSYMFMYLISGLETENQIELIGCEAKAFVFLRPLLLVLLIRTRCTQTESARSLWIWYDIGHWPKCFGAILECAHVCHMEIVCCWLASRDMRMQMWMDVLWIYHRMIYFVSQWEQIQSCDQSQHTHMVLNCCCWNMNE